MAGVRPNTIVATSDTPAVNRPTRQSRLTSAFARFAGARELVNERHAHYTNLPPRHYRFRVIASNNSGVWNEEGASLDFVIPPAWYQTDWFRVLCTAALLALLWALYRLRQQLQREERKFREAVETMPALAFVALPGGQRIFVNKRWIARQTAGQLCRTWD